jgi:hypothetical protein
VPEVIEPGGGGTTTIAYTLIAAVNTTRTTGDNSTQDVVFVTAMSKLYGVTFSWFVNPTSWNVDGGPPLIEEKTGQVNAIMQADHVLGFRTIQDQDLSRLLVNFGVITVGSQDGQVQDEVQVRMDQLGTPATFTAIANLWNTLQTIAGGTLV